VRGQHVSQVTDIYRINVPFEQPFSGVLDGSVSTVVTLSHPLSVHALNPLTRILPVGEFRLQLSDTSRVVLELFEFRTSVVDSSVSRAGDDGKSVVRSYVDSG
jgi:hypothetical protein